MDYLNDIKNEGKILQDSPDKRPLNKAKILIIFLIFSILIISIPVGVYLLKPFYQRFVLSLSKPVETPSPLPSLGNRINLDTKKGRFVLEEPTLSSKPNLESKDYIILSGVYDKSTQKISLEPSKKTFYSQEDSLYQTSQTPLSYISSNSAITLQIKIFVDQEFLYNRYIALEENNNGNRIPFKVSFPYTERVRVEVYSDKTLVLSQDLNI